MKKKYISRIFFKVDTVLLDSEKKLKKKEADKHADRK